MNEHLELNELIEKICLNDDASMDPDLISSKCEFLLEFNKKNEHRFQFILSDVEFKKKIGECLKNIIGNCLDYLGEFKKNQETIFRRDIVVKYLVNTLNTIRILSRDSKIIDSFENTDLLAKIQLIANLMGGEIHTQVGSEIVQDLIGYFKSQLSETFILNVSALKAMSNLIYNSKFIQSFYGENGVVEAISAHLKHFDLSKYFLITSDVSIIQEENHVFNIMVFDLKILFLLSIFNTSLRQKLKEFQVITHLIEILDQIMKERLNINFDGNRLNENRCVDITNDQEEFCILKSIDIDYINEGLKLLFNLTMEIASVKQNAAKTMGDINCSTETKNQEISTQITEEEAHLINLVIVLRDLITCNVETNEKSEMMKKNIIKRHDLQANIINLLTNMPKNCFEELMTPCLLDLPNSSVKNFLDANKDIRQNNSISPKFNETYLNIRISHNNKRFLRRSNRERNRQGLTRTHDKDSSQQLTNDDNLVLLTLSDESLEFEGKNLEVIELILLFMTKNLTSYLEKPTGSNADQLYPVLLLLSLMSKSNRTIRRYCRIKILPPLKTNDIIELPQQGKSIRNKLVRLMTDANIQLKRLSAQFLFILCKESVSRLVKYSGYGNAAGLLAESGLMLSQYGDRNSYSSNSEESDTEDYKKLERHINPITGRVEIDQSSKNFEIDEQDEKKIFRLKKDVFEGMSEEQKEYEAIQIVNAIDKLTRSGAIKPATIGPDGRPVEMQHVLQLQENKINLKKKE